MDKTEIRISKSELTGFCEKVFAKLGLPAEEAFIAADALVAADVRGIPSHGIGRLWRYVNGLKTGLMVTGIAPETVRETDTSVVIDARGSMGAPVSAKTMRAIIDKADNAGAAFGCVRDSNHFGIAGYYAMMALEKDMLGIAMTNTAALGVPTFGRQVMFGTNPMAFAAPAANERAFVLDMSTTVVTRGKIEVYDRLEKELPKGWAVDKRGLPAKNAGELLEDMFYRHGGGILPLGGMGEDFGGHKGYGLAIMVDILCSVLCGASFGPALKDTETSSARVGHFFGAIKIECFRDPVGFREDMDKMLGQLRESTPAEGEERVYFAGQKEFESEEETARKGIPVLDKVYRELCSIGADMGIKPPQKVSG